MDSKQFSRHAVQVFRQGFPELYEKHIRGRRAAFIAEHAPPEKPDNGKVLGKVPVQARVLWALGELLQQHFEEPSEPNWSHISQTCEEVNNMSTGSSAAAMLMAFRECVFARFGVPQEKKNTHMLCVRHDWSVSLVAQADYPTETKSSVLEMLGVILECSCCTRRELTAVLQVL